MDLRYMELLGFNGKKIKEHESSKGSESSSSDFLL